MATEETRQMFEQLLKKAERKKGGKDQKKAVTEKENEIVGNLERSLTKDDPLLENNTYNGEAEKNLKNLRNSGGVGKENIETGYIDTVDKDAPKKPSRAKRKSVKKKTEEEIQDDAAEYANVKKPVKKPRTPRKKDDASPSENPQAETEPRPVATPRKLPSNTEAPDQEETIPKSVEGTVEKKKRRKKKRDTSRALPQPEVTQNDEETVTEMQVPEPEEAPPQEIAVDAPPEESTVVRDDGTILGVTVHYCDHMRVDPKYVAHPLVKVSIVDCFTGRYFNKFDSSRHVSSFYESDSINSIVPLMTQPYDFKANRSLLPRWEELLIFNEPFLRLTHHVTDLNSQKPILFFVIRDFITMAKANNKRGGADKGWHNVAWAFLKLVNANGQPNAGRKMRLQLFYPPRTRAMLQDGNFEPAHDWWLNHPRQRYPGTLFITVKAIIPPLGLVSSVRSMFAMQAEEGALSFNEMNQSLEQAESESRSPAQDDDLAAMQQWSRLPGQTCKIPNAPFLRFWAGSKGAFMMQFSHRGTRLAAACRHEATYPILLYGVPGGEEIGVITGHQQLVYDLQWSKNDRYLLSASADGTAQVWDMERKEKPIHTLPHPCYVYAASYHATAQHLIATGGYDSIVRVWNIASVTSQLTQELDGHKAIINSIIFDRTGLNMYSADGSGVIMCWNCQAYEKAKKNIKTNWSLNSKIEDRELSGICINSLHLHPHNNKIVIHCRDSTVRLLDARIHSMKKFTGLLNYRQLLRSSVTPCGSLIFSGSEDGCVYVWNADTGDQVAIYNELGYTSAVHTVAYHPHDHLVAFCSYAPNQSILLYKFNSAVATMEAGFKADDVIDGKQEETVPSVNAHIEAAKTAVNLERIKHQLNSVLVDSIDGNAGHGMFPPIPKGRDAQIITPRKSPRSSSPYRKDDTSFGLSTWGSTFDTTTQGGSLLAPSYLSPHASPEARVMAQQYIRTGRQDQSGGWKPSVSSIGGSPYRNQAAGIPLDVSLSIDKDGKQKLSVSTAPGRQSQSVVVVLFEYQANRSDELNVVRGDVIRVLYKDSANWWFGEKTSDGKQGYFPSNYVEEQASTADIKQSETHTPVFGVPEPVKEKKVYALKMPGGRLNFYSQSESEGDDERLSNASISSRQRRREAKLMETLERGRSTPSPRTAEKSSDPLFPKSILQKGSPRSKITEQGPSTESVNIKEVSFADDKKDSKAKLNLIESIQSAIEKTEPQSSPAEKPKPSASSRQQKPNSKPKASTRSKTPPTHKETNFTPNVKAKPEPPRTPSPTSTPSFGVLKSVQALMSMKKSESAFSQSVLGGHEISTPKSNRPNETPGPFRPPIHSTAVKKARGPVENDEDPLSPPHAGGSVIRKARPLPKIGKTPTDESIPMIKMGKSRNRRSSPVGLTNPAFDATP